MSVLTTPPTLTATSTSTDWTPPPSRQRTGTRPAPSQGPVRTLTDLVLQLAARPHLWEHAVRFDAGERHWARLDGPAGVDVWLLTWLRSQKTDLHDHGRSAAAFTVVQGALTEVRPDGRGRLLPRSFAPGIAQRIEPGEIHDVRNERPEPAVSIHAYAPRLTEMTYYAWLGDRTEPLRTEVTTEPEGDR